MRWDVDGWLRTLDGDARPATNPLAPDLPTTPMHQERWNGRFDRDSLPQEFQWLRTPLPERLFSLTERPGHLRLYGRETVGSHFEQALIARRLEHLHFTATTCLDFSPHGFQQAAGLILYYNSTKYYYLNISVEAGIRELQLMIASPELEEGITIEAIDPLPEGPIELKANVAGDALTFGWRAQADTAWHDLPQKLDATVLSDEVTSPGLPNFTGTFVGMACQDLSGMATPADFAWFVYDGGEDICAPVD
jgi:xylan 1,4-beta-xylosidase